MPCVLLMFLVVVSVAITILWLNWIESPFEYISWLFFTSGVTLSLCLWLYFYITAPLVILEEKIYDVEIKDSGKVYIYDEDYGYMFMSNKFDRNIKPNNKIKRITYQSTYYNVIGIQLPKYEVIDEL